MARLSDTERTIWALKARCDELVAERDQAVRAAEFAAEKIEAGDIGAALGALSALAAGGGKATT